MSAAPPTAPRFPFGLISIAVMLLAASPLIAAPLQSQTPQAELDFNRDIRPILSNHCFTCHGPDSETRKMGLRLDTREGAMGELKFGGHAIVAGQPEQSELYLRVSAEDDLDRMPPPETGKALSREEIEKLRRWIEGGATWNEHWSFRTPLQPEIPAVGDAAWSRNEIDRFVLAELERRGLAPLAIADSETLIRRLTLDLTGLPPTLEEIEAFLADSSPDAYEKVVDRLLASESFGEHWARYWLDAARYADTHGFHIDAERSVWRWRDWVIHAFNANMPFDQFTIEQLAGDLLPNATLDQKIATGFLRNNPTTGEGGLIEEEYLVKYAVDRLDTTATVWMGLTLACAQCHDHKFDPISQKEFYRFFSYFHNNSESGSDGNQLSPVPAVAAPLGEQVAALERLDQQIATTEKAFTALADELGDEQAKWEVRKLAELLRPDEAQHDTRFEVRLASFEPTPEEIPGLKLHYPLDQDATEARDRGPLGEFGSGLVNFAPGRLTPAAAFDGTTHIDLGDTGSFEADQSFSYGCWVRPASTTSMAPIARMDDAQSFRGWDLYLYDGRAYAHLIHQWPSDAIRVNTTEKFSVQEWHHVFVTYDGSRKAEGVRIYIDGHVADLAVTHDDLRGSMLSEANLRIGARTPGSVFQGLIDDVRIYDRVLAADEVAQLCADFGAPWQRLRPSEFHSEAGATLERLEDDSLLVKGGNPDQDVFEIVAETKAQGLRAVRLEALTHPDLPHGGAGRAHNANFVLGELELEVQSLEQPERRQRLRFSLADADYSQKDYEVAKAIDGNPTTGWAVDGHHQRRRRTAVFTAAEPFGFAGGSRLKFRLIFDYKQHAIGRLRLSLGAQDLPPAMLPTVYEAWHSIGPFKADAGQTAYDTAYPPESAVDLAAEYDSEQTGGEAARWQRQAGFVDGKTHNLAGGDFAAVYLFRRIYCPSPRRLEFSLGSDDRLKVWIDGKSEFEFPGQRAVAPDQNRIEVELAAGEHEFLMKIVNDRGGFAFYFQPQQETVQGLPLELAQVLRLPSRVRNQGQRVALRDHYIENFSPAGVKLKGELDGLKKEREEVNGQVPRTLIMEEREMRRPSFLLMRGQYDRKGDEVEPGVPAVLPPLPSDSSPDRLGLARWLVDPAHPLTSRVTVNRFWQQIFGTGLVRTSEDFGSQGEWPSHPELLDWLARDFVDHGWDVKRLLRQVVTSATYRQATRIEAHHREQDPFNRLLARAGRYRLDAEVIRDQALALSGLLVRKLGGKSVKPYQPPGLWKEVAYGSNNNAATFKKDEGDALYRRSLYTFWKRTAPPPSLTTLDAPSREHCVVRRSRTNTPLQALTLMNDEQFVEAARAFAERILREAPTDLEARLSHAFRMATGRRPDKEELAILALLYQQQREEFQAGPEAAKQWIEHGDSMPDATLDVIELGTWTVLANLILNLDEVLTRR